MQIGVPTEIKNNEYRVALTPAGVAELTRDALDLKLTMKIQKIEPNAID